MRPEIIIPILVVHLVGCGAAAALANGRGRDGFGGFFLALFASPVVALLYFGLSGDPRREAPIIAPTRAGDSPFWTCKKCGAGNDATADKCHCGAWRR